MKTPMMPFDSSPGLIGGAPKHRETKPAAAKPAPRGGSPDKYATSGMERAMGGLADQVHKPK